MKAKSLLFLISISIISLSLVACESDINTENPEETDLVYNEPAQYEPEYGGHLVLPVTNISSLNPLTVTNSSYYFFSKLTFESLFEFGKDFSIENQLAQSYVFIDENTINIKLKDNVYWHDGEKFTSEDVAFTINTIKYADDQTVYKKMWDNFTGNNVNINRIMDVDIIDELNLNIVFDIGFSNQLEALTFPIIPRHRFVQNSEDRQSYERALAGEDYIPIGTGPFQFVDYEKYKSISLKANENYRDGEPYISEITGRILEDNDLVITSFSAGQVDLALSSESDWEKFNQNTWVNIVEYISQDYEFLGFNFKSGVINKYGDGLRKALAYGINRQAIIENVYLGHATQIDVPIHPNSWVLSDDSNIYGYNLTKAREELSKIGLKDLDEDGLLEDKWGNEVTVRLLTNSYNTYRLKTTDMIADDLNKLGINVVKDYIENIPENLAEEQLEEQWIQVKEKIANNDYDIVLSGWNLSPVSELSFAFHSNSIVKDTNFIGYRNESMDLALSQVLSVYDKEGKLKAYEELQQIITEDLPYVSLFFKNKALILDGKVKGDIVPTFYDIYRNIEKWYIPKDFQ